MTTMTDTTSTGMPSIAPMPGALDTPAQAAKQSSQPAAKPAQAVQSLVAEGKAKISGSLNGVAETVREIATKLEGNGAGPLAKYVHDAADTVAGWSHALDGKSVDDLMGDAKTLVRTSPALAVGLAVAAGFAVSRVVRSGR